MENSQIFFETLIVYQITQVIVESSLTEPIRDRLNESKFRIGRFLGKLFSCFLCTSIWVASILSFFLFDYAFYLGYHNFSWFLNGLFFSCLAWFIHCLELRLAQNGI